MVRLRDMGTVARRVLLPLFALLLVVVLLEAGLRLAVRADADGNVIVYGRALQPVHPPVLALEGEAATYESSTQTRLVADPLLGWTIRPATVSADGLYASNDIGARVHPSAVKTLTGKPVQGTIRIVLLGDSFSYGEEVPFESTFGFFLEQELDRSGVPSEVINLGVPAYGVDQAYLRWKSVDELLKPDIVVLGLQMENIHRTVNILRPLYVPAGRIPFSKPRALLRGQRLEWVNMPAMGPAAVLSTLRDLDQWGLSAFEHFMPRPYSELPVWYRSRAVTLFHELLFPVENDPRFYEPGEEPAALALATLQALEDEVGARGGRLLVVHIPIVTDLVRMRFGATLPYAGLWEIIRARHRAASSRYALQHVARTTGIRSLFMPAGHYSAEGNRAIASSMIPELLSLQHTSGTTGQQVNP